jgi:hypothetical protein
MSGHFSQEPLEHAWPLSGVFRPDPRSTGTTLSGLVDAALRAELTRHELADHMAMLAQADDPDRLRQRARARAEALAAWKTGR